MAGLLSSCSWMRTPRACVTYMQPSSSSHSSFGWPKVWIIPWQARDAAVPFHFMSFVTFKQICKQKHISSRKRLAFTCNSVQCILGSRILWECYFRTKYVHFHYLHFPHFMSMSSCTSSWELLFRQMQSKPEEKFSRTFSSQCLDWSCIAEKRRSPEKNPPMHSNLFSRVELSLGTTICARSLVIWEISCATHTNIKVLTITLNIGYPGMSTKIPFVSAASQMWYWQMKSCKKK